jgi:hypothetical protein
MAQSFCVHSCPQNINSSVAYCSLAPALQVTFKGWVIQDARRLRSALVYLHRPGMGSPAVVMVAWSQPAPCCQHLVIASDVVASGMEACCHMILGQLIGRCGLPLLMSAFLL